jgi:large-conductance mechanosensitive channel
MHITRRTLKKLSNKNLIIMYVISAVGYVLKKCFNDINFMPTIFIYLGLLLVKEKLEKRGHLIPKGSTTHNGNSIRLLGEYVIFTQNIFLIVKKINKTFASISRLSMCVFTVSRKPIFSNDWCKTTKYVPQKPYF